MTNQNPKGFSFSFLSSQPANKIFSLLLNIDQWWSGLYSETISGTVEKLNDEFTFSAGGGAHFSKQKLIELIPDRKIAWLVTESNLSFLTRTDEWTNTKICFDLSTEGDKTRVSFTHEGLVPKIECYNGCAGAWTSYLENLQSKLS